MNQFDELDILDSFADKTERFSWYSLRVLSINEDQVADAIREKVKHFLLSDKIIDIQVLKEHKIEESKEYLPNSSELPLRSAKGNKSSVWVKTPYGKIKKIRIAEIKPFKGLIFIKTSYNENLFRTIKSWDKSTYFLGDPVPQAMSEDSFNKMRNSLNQKPLSIEQHIIDNDYSIIYGTLRDLTNIKPMEDPSAEVFKPIDPSTFEKQTQDKPAIFDDDEYIPSNVEAVPIEEAVGKRKIFTSLSQVRVNDIVFVNDFGSQGSITDINPESGEVIVSVQTFGRSQPIVCQIHQLSEV